MTDSRQRFVDLVVGYRSAKILLTANALGVFDALAPEPLGSRDVAKALGLEPRACGTLLKSLVALGFLERQGERYANATIASEHLVRGQREYVGDNLAFQELIWKNWSELTDIVRGGRPPRVLGELLGESSRAFTRDYIRGMANIAAAPAEQVSAILGDQPIRRMLDVGGGPGTYTLALLERHLRLEAALLDLPNTLEITAELVQDHPARERLTLLSGDYLRDAFAGEMDLVLMSHITHDESPEANAHLFQKAYAALDPGGRIAVHDFTVSDDGCSPPFAALFSVNMLTYTEGGQCYSREEYRCMLRGAGFEDLRIHELSGQPSSTLLVGNKPPR
jgi:3-hydroxy-5-methyl-1-naphthoate 3-O-methyltransferase